MCYYGSILGTMGKGVFEMAAESRRVRISVRQDAIEAADKAAAILGVPSGTTLLGVAAGIGMRFLELAVVTPVSLSRPMAEAVGKLSEDEATKLVAQLKSDLGVEDGKS
jgi:hypothetical protein